MDLSFEQIKRLTVGSVNTRLTDRGVEFAKCTDKQIAAWNRVNETYGFRAAATTGVRLDFHTNSQSLAFRVLDGNRYAVKINGLTVATYTSAPGDAFRLDLRDPLGGRLDEYRVTIVLPSHENAAIIDYVSLDEGSFVRPHEFDCKMLFIGDSITQGWESSNDSFSFAYRVSEFFNAESIIQGIGGAFYNEESFDRLPFDPDMVFVAYGTNDFKYYGSYEQLKMHAEAHLSLIAEEYRGKKIFVISPIWRERREGMAMGSFEGCREVIIDAAEKFGLIHIDGLGLVPPMPALFADRYLHPNDVGFAFYSENLIKEIQKHI